MPVGPKPGDSAPAALTVDQAAEAFDRILSAPEDKPADTGKADAAVTPEKPEAKPEQESDAPAVSEETETEGDEAEPPAKVESDATDEQPAADAPKQPRKVKVKVDGQDVEVTEEEALAGYSRTQDYTRKTQKLADERKAFEADQTATRAKRDQYIERLTAIETALESLNAEPDWDKLRQEDPAGFAQTHAAWQIHKERMDKLRSERDTLEKERQAEADAGYRQYRAAQREKLLDLIPEWKDAEVGKKGWAELLAYGKEQGFDTAALNGVSEALPLAVLHKAMLYDRGVKAAAEATARGSKKVDDAVKTVEPGAVKGKEDKTVTELTRAKQRLAKTGRDEDAAAVFDLILRG